MLDAKLLRRNRQSVIDGLRRRGFELDLEQLDHLTASRSQLHQQVDELRQQRNRDSKAIGRLRAQGQDTASLESQVSRWSESLSHLESELARTETAFRALMLTIPNLPDPSVPDGADESANQVLELAGTPPRFDFEPQDHVVLGEATGQLDFDAARRISGARFSVLKGPLARLHNALSQFMLRLHIEEHGYEQIYAPYIVSADSLIGTSQLPKFADDQFRISGQEERYLIATGEVSATNIVRETITDGADLPLKMVTLTPCFRREAGSYGKDVRGMIRQHQFDKVELVQVVQPEDSESALEELTRHARSVLDLLELPYRVVELCTGDLGFAAAKTYDLEVWLPGQHAYREISSCSNFVDFQARRMQARYRTPEGKTEWVHTVNGSGLAVGRTLVAVMENFQDEQGHIRVPGVLAPWMEGIDLI